MKEEHTAEEVWELVQQLKHDLDEIKVQRSVLQDQANALEELTHNLKRDTEAAKRLADKARAVLQEDVTNPD